MFETIQETVEMTYEVRMRGVDETNRLATVKSTMQESILDIQLMNRPIMRKSKRKDNPNSDRFHYRTKCLVEINTGFLGESTENPPCLVSVKGAIGLKFELKDPLVGNNVGIVQGTNKIPSVVRQKGMILINHSSMPVEFFECSTNRLRKRENEPVVETWRLSFSTGLI